ncbi:MAG TPA: hypothetical protein VJ718_03410 [Candidatus Binataceae bacterium]|jgi:hypothetical protein|nr:hypothetical protein [Candidatus Binataceae bacterium]
MSGRLYERRAGRHFNHVNRGADRLPEGHDLVNGEVIEDRSIVAQLCSEIAAQGVQIACSRCGVVDEPIAAIVIVESVQSAWLACAECWRKLPRARLVD